MKRFPVNLALILLFGLSIVNGDIDQVEDSDLVHLLTGEENVVVLFTKNDCKECDKLETALEKAKNELINDLQAVVVKALNSHMVNLYNPSKEPALIYFRRGIPLLYYGAYNAQDIVQVFTENKEPIVKELSDVNFEHLTQASTGATTGDWFLFFYSTDCVTCLRLNAVWEAVGARLKHRLTVARIDRLGAGVSTANRFGIVESPVFIFIRHGKAYRYTKKAYSVGNLLEFVEKDFTTQTGTEIVPPQSNDVNIFLTSYIDSIMNSSRFWMVSLGVFSIIILGCVKYMYLKRTNAKPTSKKSK